MSKREKTRKTKEKRGTNSNCRYRGKEEEMKKAFGIWDLGKEERKKIKRYIKYNIVNIDKRKETPK